MAAIFGSFCLQPPCEIWPSGPYQVEPPPGFHLASQWPPLSPSPPVRRRACVVLMCGHLGGMEVTLAARPDASSPAWPLLHFVNGPEVQFPQLSRIPTAHPGFVLTWHIPSWLVKPLEVEEGKPISSWLSCLQTPCGPLAHSPARTAACHSAHSCCSDLQGLHLPQP